MLTSSAAAKANAGTNTAADNTNYLTLLLVAYFEYIRLHLSNVLIKKYSINTAAESDLTER